MSLEMIERYSKDWKNPLDADEIYTKFVYDTHGQSGRQVVVASLDRHKIDAYSEFIAAEFQELVGTSGLSIVFDLTDPYTVDGKPNSDFMRQEVARTGVLHVYAGGAEGPIPFATNLLFRAAHDYQHITTGGSFSFSGECFTAIPLLRKAKGIVRDILFSEMVAQSAYYKVRGKYLDPQVVVVGCWTDEIDALLASV